MRWLLISVGALLTIAVTVISLLWLGASAGKDEAVVNSYRASSPVTLASGSGSAGVLSDTSSVSESVPTAPPTTPTPTPTPEPDFSIWVANTGGDAELDTCSGGFTHLVGFTTTNSITQTMLASHNYCGGDVVLAMMLGDVVSVDGDLFTVVEVRDVPKELTPADVQGFTGTVLLQTCYYERDLMKLAALEPVL